MSAIDKAPDPRDYVPSSQPTMPAQRFIAKPGAAIEQAPKADTGSSGAAAALESAAGGLVETAPVVPLALAGAKAGAAALSGVAPPYGAAVGATVGGIGGAALGMYAGSEAREALDLRRPADFPEADRPEAYYGDVIGGSVGSGAGLYAVALTRLRFGQSFVGVRLNQMLDTAKNMPIRAIGANISPTMSGALGAATAESLLPGNDIARLVGEVGMSSYSPTNLLIGGASRITDKMLAVVSSNRTGALDPMVAKFAATSMKEFSEDPATASKVAKELLKNYPELTFAQVTGSNSFIAIERDLAKHSERFARESKGKAESTLNLMRDQIRILMATGDPRNLKIIADSRQEYFSSLLAGKLKMAQTEALDSVSKLRRDDPIMESALSEALISRVLKEEDTAYQINKELWSKFDRNVPIPVTNLRSTVDEILAESAEVLKDKKIPGFLMEHLRKVENKSRAYNPMTMTYESSSPVSNSLELKDIRSQLLDMARAQEVPGGSQKLNGYYSRLASAVLKDMDGVFSSMNDEAYDTARAFTKSVHDTFDRSFVGQATAKGRWGDTMSPGMVVRRALAPRDQQADINLQDLSDASSFLFSRGMGTDEALQFTLDAQERIFRIVAVGSTGAQDGKISPQRVQKYITDHPKLFERFPEVKKDLEASIKTTEGLAAMEALKTRVDNVLGKQSAFSQISNSDGVAYATRILTTTSNQEKKLTDMFNLARRGDPARGISPQQGIDSARAAVLNAAVNSSLQNNSLDLDKFRGFLFNSNVVGQKPVIQVMIEQGVLDQDHVQKLKTLFKVYDNVQKWSKQTTALDIPESASEALLVFAAKVTTSRLTSAMQSLTGGSSGAQLIIHANVAKLTEQWVSKVPATKMKDAFIRLANDPKQLADLLVKHKDPIMAASQARRFHAWAVQAGLTRIEEYQRPERPEAQRMSTRSNPRAMQ